ncbi:MAG: glycosyltransferase, partial [Syntrophobacteraceae bacterium]
AEEFQSDQKLGRELRIRLRISPDMPLIMTAAMFRPGAKFESLSFLFRSLSHLNSENGDFRLLIAGDGQLKPEVEGLAHRLLPGKTIFAGAVTRSMMRHCYSAADIFAFPGIDESIGMVYLEAQACGVPVVALNEHGAAQVVENGTTGLLVTGGDGGEEMARAVGILIRDPALRKQLGEHAREYIGEKRNLWKNYRVILRELERSAR